MCSAAARLPLTDLGARDGKSAIGRPKAGDYGRIVRIHEDKVDRRIFTPTPHGSPPGNGATTAAVP